VGDHPGLPGLGCRKCEKLETRTAPGLPETRTAPGLPLGLTLGCPRTAPGLPPKAARTVGRTNGVMTGRENSDRGGSISRKGF